MTHMGQARGPVWRWGWNLHAHHRVYAAFFLYAFSFGGFFPRIAEIQRGMGVGEGALGLALIGAAAGTMVSLSFGGRWIERFGHRRVFLYCLPVISALYGLASLAGGPWALFFTLFPAGVLIGALEIVVNLEADRTEHALGRRLMNRAHAFWSMGFFAAAALGALAAFAGLSPTLHLFSVVVLTTALTVALLGRFEDAPHRPQAAGTATALSNAGESSQTDAGLVETGPSAATPAFARPTLPILALVLVTLPAMVLEGAGFDWAAIYMRDVFHSSAFLGGVAVASGAAAQAFTRFVADRFVERFSPDRVARVLLTVLVIGNLLVVLAASPVLSLLGFALMGVGSSAIFPLAMSAAAQRTDRPAAVNVASLAQTAFVSFLLAPPLLGLVAQAWGIRWAFGIALPLVVVSLWLAGRLNPARSSASK